MAAAQAPAQQQPAYEEGLMELAVRGLAQRVTVVVLVNDAGQLLLPLEPVLALTEIPTERDDSLLTLQWPPGEWETRLDHARRVVTAPGVVFPVPEAEWVVHDGALYLSAAALGALLSGEVRVDWTGLTVMLVHPGDFPAVALAKREERRGAGRAMPAAAIAATEIPVEYPARSGGLAANWSVTMSRAASTSAAGARGTLGAALWGGSLELGGALSGNTREGARLGAPHAHFSRIFPENPRIQQLQLGRFATGGPMGLYLAGAMATNEAYLLPRYFGELLVEPAVPTGWEYEVYEGNQLVGVSEPGRPGIQVPVRYGSSPLRVRLLGPAGQERVEELVFLVPQAHLPRGAWRYTVQGGRCVGGTCDAYAAAELRHGLLPWLTVGLGADRLRDAGGADRRTGLLGTASFTPWRSASVSVRARPGSYFRANAEHRGARGEAVYATYAWYDRSDPVLPVSGWRLDSGLSRLLPFGLRRGWASAYVRAQGGGWSVLESWKTAASVSVGGASASIGYEGGPQQPSLTTLQLLATPALPPWGLPRGTSLFGSLGSSRDGISLAEGGTSLPVGRRGSLSARLRHVPVDDATSLILAYSTRLPAVSWSSRVTASDRGSELWTMAQGGAGATPPGDRALTPLPAVGQAGIAGRVFIDDNANGALDPGEEPVESAAVRIGPHHVLSGAGGKYRLWGVQPYAAVAVELDTLHTTRHDLVLAGPPGLMRPTPNLFNRVDLPLAPTLEVLGGVEAEAGVRTVGGLAIEVRREGASDAAQRIRTYSDGAFYLSRLPRGRFIVSVAASSLEALGARAEPDSLVLDGRGASGSFLELPPFVLRPLAPAQVQEPVAEPPPQPQRQPEPVTEPELPLLGRVHFAFDRAELPPDAAAVLDEVVRQMESNPRLRVEVQGHTDALGTAEYNLVLSEARARAVAEYLIGRGGDRSRISVRGYGEERPLESNESEAGRNANRRVEFRQLLEEDVPAGP